MQFLVLPGNNFASYSRSTLREEVESVKPTELGPLMNEHLFGMDRNLSQKPFLSSRPLKVRLCLYFS